MKPHTVGLTQPMLMTLKFKVLIHPGYNLDLSSCDYEVFGLLKKFLEGKCFSIDEGRGQKSSQGMDVTSCCEILEIRNV